VRTAHPPGSYALGVNDSLEDLKRSRGLLMVAGVLALLAGMGAIIVPAVASVGTSVFIGIVLLAASVPLAVQAFTAGHLGITLLRLLVAALTAIAGLYLLVAPLEGTYTLTVMLVIWFVAIGFARLAGGLAHLGTPGAGATAFSGLLSVILGILIAEKLPSSADWAIGLIVGIDFLFFGLNCLWLAYAAGHLPEPGPGAEQPAV
jgi:uncharacterized membrane protein HdeD (DUF308 family)